MSSRSTRASTRAKASGDDSTSSDQLPFAPSRAERSREDEATSSAAIPHRVADDAMTRPRRLLPQPPHPYRRSHRFVCYFNGLAVDEVQSIMQMLDRRSLLRLARCSRRMHADADSEAAWSAQSCWGFTLNLENSDIGLRLRQSLLRHLPIVHVWLAYADPDQLDVQLMLTIPRITRLYALSLSFSECLQILSHPCTAGLTSLTLSGPALLGAQTVELMTQLARHTRLDTLNIFHPLTCSDLFAVLPALPALTTLRLLDLSGSVDFAPILPPALHACTRLAHLRIGHPNDGSQLFRCLFCDVQSPAAAAFLSRLEDLTLEGFDSLVRNIPASELSAAFTAMTNLRAFILHSIEGVVALLPFVPLLVGLNRFDIWSHDELDEYEEDDGLELDQDDEYSTMPTSDALQAMMQASSVRDVTLYVPNRYVSSSNPRYAFHRLDPERFTIESLT